MARHPWLDPSPFFFAGGPVGCLLLHGFTGAPTEVRLMGESLAAHGLTVSGPCLPGHGTRVEDMLHSRWRDWAGATEAALDELRQRCTSVFVGGLSMGGLLTLYLGERQQVDGLIPMAAALRTSQRLLALAPVLKLVAPQIEKKPPKAGDYGDPQAYRRHWSYDAYPVGPAGELNALMRQVRPRLHEITAPILIVQGALDNMVPPESARTIYAGVASQDKELLWLQGSGHMVTVDAERELVWRRALEFIWRHTPAERQNTLVWPPRANE